MVIAMRTIGDNNPAEMIKLMTHCLSIIWLMVKM